MQELENALDEKNKEKTFEELEELEHRRKIALKFREMHDEGKFDNLPPVKPGKKMKAIFWTILHIKRMYIVLKNLSLIHI